MKLKKTIQNPYQPGSVIGYNSAGIFVKDKKFREASKSEIEFYLLNLDKKIYEKFSNSKGHSYDDLIALH